MAMLRAEGTLKKQMETKPIDAMHSHPRSRRGRLLVLGVVGIALVLAASAWVYRQRTASPVKPATMPTMEQIVVP